MLEATEDLTRVKNQAERANGRLDNLVKRVGEVETQDPGKLISEFRQDLSVLKAQLNNERKLRKRWQKKWVAFAKKKLKRKPVPIKVVDRPTKRHVKSTSRWIKNKDGSFTRENRRGDRI